MTYYKLNNVIGHSASLQSQLTTKFIKCYVDIQEL